MYHNCKKFVGPLILEWRYSFFLFVWCKIFLFQVQLSFLHVGHTHEDIDQMFSVIADNLRHKDAATLPEMSDILYSAEELRGCFDISGWLSPCLKGVKYHTRTNTFRYVKLFKLYWIHGNIFIHPTWNETCMV